MTEASRSSRRVVGLSHSHALGQASLLDKATIKEIFIALFSKFISRERKLSVCQPRCISAKSISVTPKPGNSVRSGWEGERRAKIEETARASACESRNTEKVLHVCSKICTRL